MILNPKLHEIELTPVIGLDTETNGLDPNKNQVLVIAITNQKGVTYVINCARYLDNDLYSLVAAISGCKVVIMHNAKFDVSMLYTNYGILLRNVFDTMLMSQIITNGKIGIKHNLPAVLYRYTGKNFIESEDKKRLQKSFIGLEYGTPLTQEQLNYAGDDTKYLITLYDAQLVVLQRDKLEKIAHLENTLVPVIVKMEVKGCLIDKEQWVQEITKWEVKLKDYKEQLDKVVFDILRKRGITAGLIIDGKLFDVIDLFGTININYGSQNQILKLFKALREPLPYNKEGNQSVDEDSIKTYLNEHPDTILSKFLELLLDYREYGKLVSTYGESFLTQLDDNNYIHTRYSQCNTATGRLASSNPNCFDADTEVLTKDGWIKFKDAVLSKPAVAQWEDGEISFVQPTAWQYFKNRQFVHLRTRSTSLMVTEDHRCLVINRNTGKYEVVRAVDYRNDTKQLHSGMWKGGKGIDLTDDELRLAVAIQADGSITKHNNMIDFSFKKKRKADRLKSLLRSISYRDYSNDRRFRYYLETPHLVKYKYYGNWVFDLSRHQINIILDELFYWDGSFTRKNNYASADENNVDLLQALFALSGKRARKRLYTSQGGSISHQIDIVDSNYSWTTNHTKTDGGVRDAFCCSVPSSYIVVRRDGCVMITGQCQNIPNDQSGAGSILRDYFIAPDGYKMITSDMGSAEIRIAADYSGDKFLLASLYEGLDMHSELATTSFSIIYDEPVIVSKSEEPVVVQGQRLIPADLRQAHKTVLFAKFYKGGAKRVYQCLAKYINQVHPPSDRMEIASRISKAIDERMPDLTAYLTSLINEANTKMCLRGSKLGRIRYFNGDAYGNASNMPIQCTNADAMKVALIKADRYLESTGYGWLVLTVHDELVAVAKEEVAEEVAAEIKKIMSDSLEWFLETVNGDASVKIKHCWEK